MATIKRVVDFSNQTVSLSEVTLGGVLELLEKLSAKNPARKIWLSRDLKSWLFQASKKVSGYAEYTIAEAIEVVSAAIAEQGETKKSAKSKGGE